MNVSFFLICAALICVTCMASACEDKRKERRPVVGAIRWDAWIPGNEWERNLAPKQWRSRLPFYGKEISEDVVEVRGDSQEVMDQEIAYAKKGGIDYWAFDYSYNPNADSPTDNYGLKLLLSSKHKTDMNFTLLLMGAGFGGPKAEWFKAEDEFIRYFKEPTYQKVMQGRPLLYVFYVESMPGYFGSEEAVKDALDSLRRKSKAAGLQPPFIVAQVWSAESGVHAVEVLGFDAISAYAMIGSGDGNQEYPYSRLAEANRIYWEACRTTGKQVIPIVNAGWDYRPRAANLERFKEIYQGPPEGPWYTQPTPQELADHLRDALEWNLKHSESNKSNAVIIYAWNETDEGGWLVPTKNEGRARLEALGKVIEKAKGGE